MNDAPQRDVQPWYRHGWVWALIAIPGASVVFGIVMITAASLGPTDLVRDDYYKAGLAINQDLEARERAAALGIEVQLIDRGAAGLLLRVDAGEGVMEIEGGGTVLAELQHPTLADLDARFELDGVAWGRWATTIDRFDGVRTLLVSAADGTWVVQREVRAPRRESAPSGPGAGV